MHHAIPKSLLPTAGEVARATAAEATEIHLKKPGRDYEAESVGRSRQRPTNDE